MKDFNSSVIELLRKYINVHFNGKVSRASRALGLKDPSILAQWLNGRRVPNLSAIGPVFDSLGVELKIPDGVATDCDLIPKVVARADAGASLETSGEVEALYGFRPDFLGKKSISVSQSVLMEVAGDSMEPLLSEGDVVLVDKSDKIILDGKIYVVTLGDELRVKRIFKGLSGIILRSENKKYPDIHVTGQELDSFVIHGRVRWCGKSF